jgi:hypothetical protein
LLFCESGVLSYLVLRTSGVEGVGGVQCLVNWDKREVNKTASFMMEVT